MYANAFRFEADGAAHEGVAYAPGTCVRAGSAVLVEYRTDDPAVSRIAGMRRAPFGPGTSFVLIFPIVGGTLVAFSLRSGCRAIRLLQHGRLALGTLVGKELTNVRVNRRTVAKLRFAIATETGARHEVVVKTHLTERLEDDARERILYDPARPNDAIAWDVLTCAPVLDRVGQLQPKGLVGTALVLVPPAAAVVGHLFALGAFAS
ncbi:hypothetical protein [Anaeromyxobacter oryzae]|uniref:DUF3592 domain-containing protein n=1 Tax=Anaeromyxobacter oryzae TaxID=2918170 RepID=A0ABM7WTV1_9BACT|nr:hypothetical protein [Anaeromyxobacter oryzae]BDG02922.1 hypothetical protein AMOR_19180 [Anaeromyxobacter oryzae]